MFLKQYHAIIWNAEKTQKKNKKGRIMLSSKCEVRDSKESRFIKQKEAGGILSSLGLKTPWNKIFVFEPILL